MKLTALREQARNGGIETGLLDDPDCLAELEFTYSVFRFRHKWGTHFELTFTNLADANDMSACWALVPARHIIVATEDTDTTGLGYNGVIREATIYLLALED